MTFNIEYGGQVIDFDKVVEAVVKADADVVGLNEAYSRAKLVAAQAGYPYVSTRLDLISKYPILDPPGANGRYQFVQVSPGQVIAITNVHLSSEPYGPRRVMDGWSRRRVLRNERQTRLPEIKPFVQALEPVAAAGIPSFIIGDFNAPTHYDWTPRMVGQRPQIRYAVRWPVSVYLAEHGFADTFHEAHPNVRATPGLTWPSGRPRSDSSWNPPPDAPQDRIDQVWVAGPATTADSEVVGERGGPGVTIEVNPWGSDHRAVVSTVEAVLGTPPVMVSPDPLLVEQGQDLTVTYHAPGNAGEKVVIVPMGGDPATDGIDQAGTPAADDVDGSVVFDTATWTSGGYDAVLVDASDTELSRNLFWLRLPGERPVLHSASVELRRGGADPHQLGRGARAPVRLDRDLRSRCRSSGGLLQGLPLHAGHARGQRHVPWRHREALAAATGAIHRLSAGERHLPRRGRRRLRHQALSGPRGGALAGTLGAWRRRSVWPRANCSRSSSHPVRRGSRSCTDVGTAACRSCRWTFDWVRTSAGG